MSSRRSSWASARPREGAAAGEQRRRRGPHGYPMGVGYPPVTGMGTISPPIASRGLTGMGTGGDRGGDGGVIPGHPRPRCHLESQMADAPPLLPGLPNEIAVWEILLRLPPKPLLRCRAVSPAWRDATSTRDFLLSHHARQPALPLLYSRGDDKVSLNIIPFDHRAADRFQPVARLKALKKKEKKRKKAPLFYPTGYWDGLLLLHSIGDDDDDVICICNPATRQYALLPELKGFYPVHMYPHPPTGEYRLLLQDDDPDHAQIPTYIFTIGSGQPPRHIGCPDPSQLDNGLLFQGSIYWCTRSVILIFDTTTEVFRQIHSPVAPGYLAKLFEMGDMLGICFYDKSWRSTVDIWVMQGNQSEVWDLKCRVELPVAETNQQCQCSSYHSRLVMVMPVDSGLFILLICGDWLFQIDMDGKLIASFHHRGITSTSYFLKQTLVQHTIFPTLEGYDVNALSFI